MRSLRRLAAVSFVFAYFVYGGATIEASACVAYPGTCTEPSCLDLSPSCSNGVNWETRSCSWDESNIITCYEAVNWVASTACGGGPWYGYVTDSDCTETGNYPWLCRNGWPWDPDDCRSHGTASCTAAAGYC